MATSLNPYDIIFSVCETEKTQLLKGMKESQSNSCIKKFDKEKHVFFVSVSSNKFQIKEAVEKAFGVKVDSVRTLINKPKPKRAKGKGQRNGKTAHKKKAIVTLSSKETLKINC